MNFRIKKIKSYDDKTSQNIFYKYYNNVWQSLSRIELIILLSIIIIIIIIVIMGFNIKNTDKCLIGTWHISQQKCKILPKISIEKILKVKQDKYGHTNILLLGVAGAKKEGGYLSDSIILISLQSEDNPTLSFLSFPRDLYVKSSIGESKINQVYANTRIVNFRQLIKTLDREEASKQAKEKALEATKQAISDFANIDIHYGAVVSFDAFVEIIDTLGGLDVHVSQTIDDNFYPADNYKYQRFTVQSGWNKFDGETALKYTRSRKTSSDYSRAKRQQKIIVALSKKSKELDLLDVDKLKKIYNSLSKHVNTDMNFTDIFAIINMVLDIDYQKSQRMVLNDDPSQKGGFLYEPHKDFFDGKFVLLPRDTVEMQEFIHFALLKSEILQEQAQIEILYTPKTKNKALRFKVNLVRYGFSVVSLSEIKQKELIKENIGKIFLQDNFSDKKLENTKKFIKTKFEIVELNQKFNVETNKNKKNIDLQLIFY